MKTPEDEQLRITPNRASLPTKWLLAILAALLTLLGTIFEMRLSSLEEHHNADITRINDRIDRERERFTEKLQDLEKRMEFHWGKEIPR